MDRSKKLITALWTERGEKEKVLISLNIETLFDFEEPFRNNFKFKHPASSYVFSF